MAIVSSPFMAAYMQKINMLNRIIAELVVGKIVVVIKVPNSVNEIKVVRIKKTKSTSNTENGTAIWKWKQNNFY